MGDFIKLIGCIVTTIIVVGLPILTAEAIAENWHPGAQMFLILFTLIEIGFIFDKCWDSVFKGE